MVSNKKILSYFLIGMVVVFLASCSHKQRTYLPANASLIHEGQTKAEVTELLGPPEATVTNEQGQEVWYYYTPHKHFWNKVPLLKMDKLFGKNEVEGLQIIFDENNKVLKSSYYVRELP